MESAAVLLLSGGVESVTLLHQLAGDGEAVQALFLDYGQRAARPERAAAEGNCARLGVELVPLDLAQVGDIFRRGQERKAHVPVPHRNLVALALALSYATNLGARTVYLAANQQDTMDYAASSHAFLAQFRLIAGLLGDVQLSTPYVGFSKTEIVVRGMGIGVDYATTYSCLLGYPQHCGRCPQCMKRQAAFHDAGYVEPAGFYRTT
jgi:7-cyano-7-deazaguanine synthase